MYTAFLYRDTKIHKALSSIPFCFCSLQFLPMHAGRLTCHYNYAMILNHYLGQIWLLTCMVFRVHCSTSSLWWLFLLPFHCGLISINLRMVWLCNANIILGICKVKHSFNVEDRSTPHIEWISYHSEIFCMLAIPLVQFSCIIQCIIYIPITTQSLNQS